MNLPRPYFLLFFLIECISANAQFTFEKTYSINNQESGNCLIQSADSGFILGGGSNNWTYLIKVNDEGDTLWSKVYGAPYSGATSIQPTYDLGFAIGGSVFNGAKFFASVLKIDSAGDTLWTRAYGEPSGTLYDQGFSLKNTSDSGFVIAGTTNNFTGYRGFYLLKITGSGILQWANKFNSHDALFDGVAACQTIDGGYAMVGITHLFITTLDHMLVVKTDAFGDTLWTGSFISNGNNYPAAIEATNDGGMIISGYTDGFGNGNYDAFLLKLDSTGNQQWAKVYGGANNESCRSLAITADGGYLFTGNTNSFSTGDDDVFLVKTDNAGNTIWSSRFGNTNDQDARDAIQSMDGGFAVCGTTDFGGIPIGKLYFIKTDSLGNGCSLLQISSADSAIAFSRISIPIDVINTPSITTSFGYPVSSGSFIGNICFNQGACAGYNVIATSSADTTCQVPIQLNAFASTGTSIFEWTPAANLSNPNSSTPVVHFSFYQDFIVTATDTLTGCFNSDTLFGISALNDFGETFSTCGSFTYDFFLPAGADSYLWSSYTDSVGVSHTLNDTNQFITTVGAPCVYYGVAYFSGCQVNGTYNLLDTCSTVGLQDISSVNIEIYPNPAHDYIVIHNPGVKNQRIEIADRLGKIVYETKHAESLIQISTKEFMQGMYIVTIEDGMKSVHRKIQIIN